MQAVASHTSSDSAANLPTRRWEIYLIESVLIGTFMVSACVFAVLIFHPASVVENAVHNAWTRRILMGLAMGATAVALIYSRPGKRSGAHMNPAVTLSYLRLGRIAWRDAIGYIAAQFLGAVGGVALMALLLHGVADPSVDYVTTRPGDSGVFVAWLAEFSLSFVLMSVVQTVNRRPRLAPHTGWFAGLLVCLYITFEAPLSGMSLNPARSFGSALLAQSWSGLWVYFTAPVAGMLLAVEAQRRLTRQSPTLCCKLSHCSRVPCVIPCNCVTHLPVDASQQAIHH